MKKSQFKVIELFIYAVLVAGAIFYAVSYGGFNAPPIIIEETQIIIEEKTPPPPYIPPPKGEFLP